MLKSPAPDIHRWCQQRADSGIEPNLDAIAEDALLIFRKARREFDGDKLLLACQVRKLYDRIEGRLLKGGQGDHTIYGILINYEYILFLVDNDYAALKEWNKRGGH